MQKMWRVEQNTTSSEYSITRGVGNSRGQQKTRVVSPVIGHKDKGRRGNRGGNKRLHTCGKFTCRQGRGWTQRQLQAQRKFFVGEG